MRTSSITHGLDRMITPEAYRHVGGLVEELRGAARILHAEVPT